MLNLDPLTTVDEFFLLDWQKNRANIITLMKINKVTDYGQFRDFLIQKVTSTRRTRSKLVKVFGEYYFKEIVDRDEYMRAIGEAFVRIDDGKIRTDEDIQAFIAKEQTIRDPHENLQYKVFVVCDYSKTESLLLLKSHHCMMDGVATMACTGNFEEGGYSKSQFHRLAPIKRSILTEIIKFATLPISMVVAFNSLFAYPGNKNVNELNPKGRLTGERKVTYSKPLNTEVILDKLKKLGISFNEFAFALVTLSLSELIDQVDEVQACVPFTLRDFPNTFKELKVHNDFACLPKMLYFPKDSEGKRIKLCKNSALEDSERFKSTLL